MLLKDVNILINVTKDKETSPHRHTSFPRMICTFKGEIYVERKLKNRSLGLNLLLRCNCIFSVKSNAEHPLTT